MDCVVNESIDSFDPAAFASRLARSLGVPSDSIQLIIAAASVRVRVVVQLNTFAEAERVHGLLSTLAGSGANLSTFFGYPISSIGAPILLTATIAAPSPPPPQLPSQSPPQAPRQGGLGLDGAGVESSLLSLGVSGWLLLAVLSLLACLRCLRRAHQANHPEESKSVARQPPESRDVAASRNSLKPALPVRACGTFACVDTCELGQGGDGIEGEERETEGFGFVTVASGVRPVVVSTDTSAPVWPELIMLPELPMLDAVMGGRGSAYDCEAMQHTFSRSQSTSGLCSPVAALGTEVDRSPSCSTLSPLWASSPPAPSPGLRSTPQQIQQPEMAITQKQASTSATALLADKTAEERDAAIKDAAEKAGAPNSWESAQAQVELTGQFGEDDAPLSSEAMRHVIGARTDEVIGTISALLGIHPSAVGDPRSSLPHPAVLPPPVCDNLRQRDESSREGRGTRVVDRDGGAGLLA